MTKKIFAMFLAVLMVVSMLPTSVFAAETDCPGKGQHTLENCTYTVVKVTEPKCGDMGFTTYKCVDCEETFAESWVPATGEHQWVDLPAKAPTCAEAGYEAGRQCSICNKPEPGKRIPQLDENATQCEWVDLTPYINCETGGTKKFECAKCGASYSKELIPGENISGEHVWDNENPVLKEGSTGIAVVTCTICGDAKEVEILSTHKHDHVDPAAYIFQHAQIDATCTTDGMKSYLQCRVCNAVNYQRDFGSYKSWGWYQLTDAEWATLVIPAAHDFECPDSCKLKTEHKHDTENEHHEATCVDTVLHCQECQKDIPVDVSHNFEEWITPEDGKPTCVKSGYEVSVCANCGIAQDTKIIPALKHYEVTVTVPATCVSNAYTYTYCTRIGCTLGTVNPTDNPNTTDEIVYSMKGYKFTPATGAALDKAFYLGSTQTNLETVLYFAGAMDGKYLTTTHDFQKATKVMLEIVHPKHEEVFGEVAYFMYFFNNAGEKTYIDAYASNSEKGYVDVRLTATPGNYWFWDNANGTIVCKVETEKYGVQRYALRTQDEYKTMGVTYTDGLSSKFITYLCDVNVMEDVKVLNHNVVKDSIDLTNHKMVEKTITEPTCTEPGMKQVYCERCGGNADLAEIPAAHKYENMLGNDKNEIVVKGETVKASKPVDCTDGWQYKKCAACGDIQKDTTAGYGHKLTDLIEETPDHMNPVVYDHKDCIYCDHVENVTKKTWNDANKHWDTLAEAKDAHKHEGVEGLTGNPVTVKPGDCTEYGLEMYTCGHCKKAVYVKIEGTAKHVVPEGTAKLDPTCTTDGYIATYKCERCDAIVGDKGLNAEDNLNKIPALGHKWKENENYEAADCDKPNYNAYTHYCERCGKDDEGNWITKKGDGTKHLWTKVFASESGYACEATSFEYYECHCGEEHMISFIQALGHNFVELPRVDANGNPINGYVPATCRATGLSHKVCTFCGKSEDIVLPKLDHVNAAGQSFTDKCTDTVEDRHCVECHKANNHNALGNAHDCYKADLNKDGVLDCSVCEIPCIIERVCHYVIDKNYASTCLQDAYTLKVCGDCGDQIMTPNYTNLWNGHKPASNVEEYYKNEDGEVVKYPTPTATFLAGYVYDKDYVWYSIEIDENGNFKQHSEAYVAKYIEYVDSTYTTEGYAKMYCQECKEVVTQIIPKKTGLGFEFDVKNVLGGTEFTYGSLIEVTVYANGNNADVHGFNFNVSVNETLMPIAAGAAVKGAKFVGYEKLNDDFNLIVTNPSKTAANAKVSGFAANDASGKQQNITINGKTELVKLYFRLADKAFVDASSLTAKFEPVPNQPAVTVLKDGNSVDVSANTNILNKDFATRGFLNFNNDTAANTKDLQMAMSMITLEHVDGKTYDVTVDVNKDGVVDLQDLSIAYNYVVGNYDLVDLLVMGISAEEILLLDLNEKVLCNNPNCQYELDADWNRCPICGNYQ